MSHLISSHLISSLLFSSIPFYAVVAVDQIASELKKSEGQLVMSRAEHFREQMEEYDVLQKATPLFMKHGRCVCVYIT